MIIARNIQELSKALLNFKDSTKCLAPSMGALHRGHLSLVERAKECADCAIVSIFVNPAQFNNPKDLEKYPKDLDADLKKLEDLNVDLAFVPEKAEIYPDEFQTEVQLSELSQPLEGIYRPGHFAGVCTVVSILFNLIRPQKAIFGEKDFQQLRIIEQLVEDLKYDIEILRAPTIRENSGLALSSRNALLSEQGKSVAKEIYKALQIAQESYPNGLTHLEKFKEIEIQYFEQVSEKNLEQTTDKENARIIFAGFVEGVRLIDNIKIT